jgi:hypothetical protein
MDRLWVPHFSRTCEKWGEAARYQAPSVSELWHNGNQAWQVTMMTKVQRA